MTSKTAGFLAIVGFLLTLGGVGGIETSTTDTDMLSAMILSCVGLAIMYCAVAAVKVSDYYDRIKDNPTLR